MPGLLSPLVGSLPCRLRLFAFTLVVVETTKQYGQPAGSMIFLTLRRSMLSSRAIARWLWPASCQAAPSAPDSARPATQVPGLAQDVPWQRP
jgi:hypothetical protein